MLICSNGQVDNHFFRILLNQLGNLSFKSWSVDLFFFSQAAPEDGNSVVAWLHKECSLGGGNKMM